MTKSEDRDLEGPTTQSPGNADALRPDESHAPSSLPALLGLMSDEPELLDKILEDIYRARETQPLRLDDWRQP